MKATRRGVLAGALAAPVLAGLPRVASASGGDAVLLHDPSLEAGRRFAEAYAGKALPIEGDRIRFARAVFAKRPAFVVGVSRPADALLIEDVGREAGYAAVSDGVEGLRKAIERSASRDTGLVLAWVLAPRS